MVSAKEAKQTLERLRKRNRERQREFAEKQRKAGYKRIQCFITPGAYERLDDLRSATGKNTGDIVSEAIEGCRREPTRPETEPQAATRPLPDDPERAELVERIIGMGATMTRAEIAEQLNANGIPTPSGRGAWTENTVNNLVRRSR